MKLALHCGAPALFTDLGELWAYGITAGLRYPGDKYNTLKAHAVGNWTIDGMSAFCDNVRMESYPLRRRRYACTHSVYAYGR